MGETRRKFDKDFREGAVRLVRETGKPVAQVARRRTGVIGVALLNLPV
jgi:transposase-like protein